MIQDLRYVRNFLTLNLENMKNYLISIGGNSTSNVLSIERNFEEIIAVDSGVEHLFRLSLVPNTLIGDLDSISEKSLDKIKKNRVDINILLNRVRADKKKEKLETIAVISLVSLSVLATGLIVSF